MKDVSFQSEYPKTTDENFDTANLVKKLEITLSEMAQRLDECVKEIADIKAN